MKKFKTWVKENKVKILVGVGILAAGIYGLSVAKEAATLEKEGKKILEVLEQHIGENTIEPVNEPSQDLHTV